MYSNVLEQGELLYKDPRLSWKEAGEDAGGYTRLGPSDFPQGDPKDRDLDTENFHGHEVNRVLFDLLEASEEPESASFDREPFVRVLYPAGGGGGDPPDLLMHLVVHYLRMTEPGHDDGRWGRLCSCPGILPHRRWAGALRYALSNALKQRGLPSLKKIILALRAVRVEEVSVA
jgi:hypothetical protein